VKATPERKSRVGHNMLSLHLKIPPLFRKKKKQRTKQNLFLLINYENAQSSAIQLLKNFEQKCRVTAGAMTANSSETDG